MINPSFELPYEAHPQHDNVLVAHGWHPWWSDKKWPDQDQNTQRPLAVPEYKPITAYTERILDGASSQCFFVQFKLMNAGLYQQISVPAGRRCTFGVAMQTWCSNAGDPHVSNAELNVRVGLDPRGGLDREAEGVVWGNWVWGTAEYARMSVSTVSETETITAWIWAWNKWAMTHNDVYLDAATFEVEGIAPELGDTLRVEVTGPDGGPIQVQLVGASMIERVRAWFARKD